MRKQKAAKYTFAKIFRASIISGKHNCVSGQHKCLFEKSRDISRAVGLSNADPVKGCLPSNTKKNPKDCMTVTLRSGRGLEEKRNVKKKTKEETHTKIREETKQYSLEIIEEERTVKVQQKQSLEEGDLRKK